MSACPSCNTDYAAGTRWCSICHTNVINPEIGRLSSPGKRLGAYVLDVFIPLVLLVFFYSSQIAEALVNDDSVGAISIVCIVLLVIYVAVSLILFAKGGTIGKKLLGIRVVKENGLRASFFTMLIREWIGKSISALVLSLGFLWILIDKENQGWHDKLMSTYVVSDFSGQE